MKSEAYKPFIKFKHIENKTGHDQAVKFHKMHPRQWQNENEGLSLFRGQNLRISQIKSPPFVLGINNSFNLT